MNSWFRRAICWLQGRSCAIETNTLTYTVEGESLPFKIVTQWYCPTCGQARRCEWRTKK